MRDLNCSMCWYKEDENGVYAGFNPRDHSISDLDDVVGSLVEMKRLGDGSVVGYTEIDNELVRAICIKDNMVPKDDFDLMITTNFYNTIFENMRCSVESC